MVIRRIMESGAGGRYSSAEVPLASPNPVPASLVSPKTVRVSGRKRKSNPIYDNSPPPKRNPISIAQETPKCPPAKKGPPSPARVFIEVKQLQELLGNKQFQCRNCHGQIGISFEHVGVASIPKVSCTNCKEGIVSSPLGTNMNDGAERDRKRLTDFAINVVYVMAFLTVGDGGSEAERLMGMLDLPRNTSMDKWTFGEIERQISPTIIAYVEECLINNLIEEVRQTYAESGDDHFDFDRWTTALRSSDAAYLEQHYPRIKGSNDMGWQKRSSGNRYDSTSGHSVFVGAKTRKPCGFVTYHKYCRVCSLNEDKDNMPEHDCTINHEGSSGSMEPLALVNLVHHLYDDKKVW